ncbi:MAG: MerR family transcriptional regulator [Erysipelotrichaceae bacterium]|nr:MerR family transcriptional regulator [Erysipelotrichaceae bacterium]
MTIKEVSQICGLTPDTLRYYEKIGAIPAVKRNSSQIRDCCYEDLRWIELAKCMRAAGLSVEVLVEYLQLYQQGGSSIDARLTLLSEQRKVLLEQKLNIEIMLNKLNYKIAHYEEAVKTGHLSWDAD